MIFKKKIVMWRVYTCFLYSLMDAPIHGNYHGYYQKRPSTHDARLSLLPRDIFRGKRVLDIGCNEGWVTCEIGLSCPFSLFHLLIFDGRKAQSWGAHKVLGVDIDETLVRAAWRRRKTVWSLQEPAQSQPDPTYFPAAFEHTLGPLPIPPAGTSTNFPHNVSFRAADWVTEEIMEDKEGYDVVLA
jgi:7SK snRNA methylphosphate capping enzyme